jgi:pimeloyl-ACP methyl ester carboxylesterase
MTPVHHRYATVGGLQLFYRESGPADGPAVVLLHGFPASSFMFRDLIPLLADRYHVIAPDHLGFGLSDAPTTEEFEYTFDALAGLTAGLLGQLGVRRYAIYVHDYGAPVGWRLALSNPDSISAIITQNGNGYEAGFAQAFWKPVREYWENRNPQTEAAIRQALTLEAIKWQYLQGVPDQSVVSPDTWYHDYTLVSRPGNDLVQLQLFADYASNLPLYPRLHATSVTATSRCWPCGAATTRSLPPPARSPSPMTRPVRRSICSTAGTSSSKASWTQPRATSAASSEEHSHDRIEPRPRRLINGPVLATRSPRTWSDRPFPRSRPTPREAAVRRTVTSPHACPVRRELDSRQRKRRAAARAWPLPGGLLSSLRHRRRRAAIDRARHPPP